MEYSLTPTDFLNQSVEGVVIDVRTPSEFAAGHIPVAINLPIFTDDERAEVGTLYVKVGKEKAIEKGLEIVGPKLATFVIQARKLSSGKPLFLYCWRGGMRSSSMAWLFRTAGFTTYLLQGGYKAYRHAFNQLLTDNVWKLIILGGVTGCGKTEILSELKKSGEQVIDLEGLAHHKGSAFGHLGEAKQPTTEQFGNDLHNCMRTMDPQKPVWCEGESPNIGQVYMPGEFRACMLAGLFIQFEMPKALRIKHILKSYGEFKIEELIRSFQKLEKRLGGEATKLAIESVEKGDLNKAIEIALSYYDKGYSKSIRKSWAEIHPFRTNTTNTQNIAQELLTFYKTITIKKMNHP